MRTPIYKSTYDRLKAINEKENQFVEQLGKNWLDANDRKEMKKFADGELSNKETSNLEVYEWLKLPPQKKFVYINLKSKPYTAITWTGQILGEARMGLKYQSNFRDVRMSIDVLGNNGIKYHGTFFCSAGDYARIKAYKN